MTGLIVSVGVPAASAATNPDSLGTDFWLAFPGNLGSGDLTLFVTGPTAAIGTVDVPGVAFSTPFTVTPGSVTSVSLPSGIDIQTSDTVENLGIHVTASAEVTVYGLNRIQFTTDAYLGLPTDILGTQYLVEGYMNVDIVEGTEFAVVAAQNGTTVTINPKVTTDGHTAGTPYTVNLNQGQTYQLRNTDVSPADLSGSIVTSDKPIAVFGGHECANIPQGYVACDHVVEEMTPTATWGKSFVTEPLATRTGGDTFRYLADTDGTIVKVNGATVATLNRGQLFEQILTAASAITSDKPILVTQYSNSSSFDGVTSDPFEVIVPPSEQFLNSYTVTTPATGFNTNFINVVAPTASLGSIKLDGVAVPGASFTAIPGTSFSGAQLPVALGSHTMDGAQPFGITVYGFADYDSYGYPGGLSLAPVATVTSVALAPKTATNPINTEHCVTATVKDQNANPVVGVRVDFSVTGVNPTSGFVNSAADGTAKFCYTGTNAGSDTITAAVGSLSDTATKLWTSSTTDTAVSYTGPATVQYSDPLTLSGHLQTSTGTAIAGESLGFVLGTDNKTAGPTNASGNASAASYNELQQPGSATSVATTFAGNGTYGASSDSDPFTIAKEDCTVTYTGDILVNAANPTTLSAQFGELDSSPGDWSGKLITFTVTDAAFNTYGPYTATTNSSGLASTTANLGPNVYSVGVSFAGDNFYQGCASAADTIVTVQAANAKITGGGWISQGTGKTSFGFNVIQDVTGLKGQLQVRVRNGKDKFHSTSVLTLNSSGNAGTWTGTGRWNGVTGYTFTVSVVDNGTSGKKGDTISIEIKSPTNVTVFTTGGAQPLKGGNIVVH
jgi:hypothetical protein